MFHNFSRSLAELAGEDYTNYVCSARAALTGESEAALRLLAHEQVAFCPSDFFARQEALLSRTGEQIAPAMERAESGAPSDSYRAAQHNAQSPLSGFGCYRVGEDGKLYFAGKSEHYQIPLGHSFPGYRLIDIAKRLGIPNATHNNTRGYLTRKTERRLIAAANGVSDESAKMEEIIASREPGVLNRVINLETGSLAVEAAIKMMLARFYPIDGAKPVCEGRTPVFLVMADNAGGITAGYHGTTLIAQMLRGLWPMFGKKAEEGGLCRVVGVPINDPAGFEAAIAKWNEPPYQTAGFLHEIIMMNYGSIRLDESFLQSAYRLCRETNTPVLCDEIQSCAWYEGLFLFRKYGIRPDFVSVGKGFPGGNYASSHLIFSGAVDNLIQFGALVTNGQEELASLSYLVTMEFIAKNGAEITRVGARYHEAMVALAAKHKKLITGAEGDAHMSALCFDSVSDAIEYCKRMQQTFGVDISAQTYKPNCPPVALTKLPIIITESMALGLVEKMDRCLTMMEEEKHV